MCACGCGQCGLGRMAFSILPRGLSGLGDIKTGSRVRVGFRYSCATCLPGSIPDDAELINTIQGCLYATGAYSSVSVSISHGIVYQDYLTVSLTTAIDFGKAEDIGGQVQATLQQCYPDFSNLIDSRDAVLVDAVPVGTPIQTVDVPAGTPGGPPAPDKCATKQGLEYLSCKAGLDSSGAGFGLGTTGILLLLVAVVALAKK